MSNFNTLNKRLKECHNDMDFLKKNGITVDIVKAERRRRDAAAKAERRRRDAVARTNAGVGLLGADAVLKDILLDQQKQNNPTPSEYKTAPPEAPAGGRKTRKMSRKRRRKKKKSRRKKKTLRRRKKRKTR
jgi:hypothetical protein